MKKASTIFLQFLLVLIGIAVLTLMLWEPHLEGRNAKATLFEIYFKDPFLAYVYAASIAFFIALYQGFKVLGWVRQNKTFAPATVAALRRIKHCALALIGFVAGAVFFIFMSGEGEPGGVVMCLLASFIFVIIAAAAAMFERIFQNALDLKAENDLTV